MVPTTANEGYARLVREEWEDAIAALAELERDELRAGPDGPKEMNPRAWIVTKQGMTGDLYEALAWDNGGKPLGVSASTPTPLYEGEALRAKLTKLNDLPAGLKKTTRATAR